jgi:hypothetical protein
MQINEITMMTMQIINVIVEAIPNSLMEIVMSRLRLKVSGCKYDAKGELFVGNRTLILPTRSLISCQEHGWQYLRRNHMRRLPVWRLKCGTKYIYETPEEIKSQEKSDF